VRFGCDILGGHGAAGFTDRATSRCALHEWRCPVAAYLDGITRSSKELKSRYLILWAKKHPEFYVQCHFFDDDRQVHCEAASGFYYPKIAGFATAEQLEALARIGFSTDATHGNFAQERPFRVDEVATLLIETLARVFAFNIGDALEYNAPLLSKRKTNRVRSGPECAAISAL
jgi:hypothetical protein